MWKRIALVVGAAAAVTFSAVMVVIRLAESGESLHDKVLRAWEEDANEERFSGRLGDFLVLTPVAGEAPPEARIYECAQTPVPLTESLRNHELWSDAFGDAGIGWSCPGRGVVLVNNSTAAGLKSGDGSAVARGYFWAIPVPVLHDAPRGRLELIEVEGHPGLLERPVEGYPYGRATLTVIERYPERGKPGIIVSIFLAPSADAAIERAEKLMP